MGKNEEEFLTPTSRQEEFSEWLLEVRGVRSACTRCLGVGVKSYGSTATWHGGVGGQSITSDVCDACWGSGDSERPWLNLRLNAAKRREWENEQCMIHFASVANLNLETKRAHFAEIAKLLEREERRRKTPFDNESNGLFWRITLRGLAKTIRKLSGNTCDD